MRKGCAWSLAGAVSGLALAIGLLARRVDLGSALGDLDRAERDYRAQGLPWSAADLGTPHVPAAQNAAPLLRRAVAAAPQDVLSRRASSIELARFGPALTLAHAAAARPALDLGRDWDAGFAAETRVSWATRRLALAFAARARSRAAAGDDAGTLADLEDARRLGALLAPDPTMASLLASLDCATAAYAAARDILLDASPVRRQRLRRWLAKSPTMPDLARAWRGQIYLALSAARNLSHEQIAGFLLPRGLGPNPWKAPAASPVLREGLPDDPLARAFTARCLRLNTKLAAVSHRLGDPAARLAGASEAIRRRGRQEETLSHALDDLLFPVYRQIDRTLRRPAAARSAALLVYTKAGH